MFTMPTNTAAEEAEIGVVGGMHTGREARNLAEKHRRDKLNASIQELASMVPHVADSTRRMDKTAVLRFAAHGLRVQYVFGKSVPGKRSGTHMTTPGNEPHFTEALTQLIDSFFITLTCHGQIVVISASVEQLLGHCQSDLYGQNILSITHPDDQTRILQQLIPRDMEALFRSSNEYQMPNQSINGGDEVLELDSSGDDYCLQQPKQHTQCTNSLPYTDNYLADIDRRLRNDRRSFTVRLARAGTRSEAARSYECVKIDGCFRRSDFSCSAGTFPIVSKLIRRTRSSGQFGLHMMQHDVIAQAALHGISGNDMVLVAMARIIREPKIMNRLLGDSGQLEYRTRHLIDGRIVDCDQRIGLVAGYMKDEVCNLSPFSFMHQDDVRWVIVALRQMYDCNSDYGESCYRLLTRNGHFIYLQTKGYLEIDKNTNKVHSFICINTLMGEEEGRKRVQEMKNKFSVIIKTKIPSNSLQDVPASQNPQQLERIVLYLIENLQKRHDSGTGTGCGAAPVTQADNMRYTKTPPLALVPPEPASVKNSISQSVSVVNVTAAKNLQNNINQLKSPHSIVSSDLSLSPASSIDLGDDFGDHMGAVSPNSIHSNAPANSKRPSVLQLNSRTSTTDRIVSAPPPRVAEKRLLTPSSPNICVAAETHNGATDALQQEQQQISVLKRLHPTPAPRGAIITANEESAASSAKRGPLVPSVIPESLQSPTNVRTAEIHGIINTSLESIDQSLHNIQRDARTLCHEQSRLLPRTVPRAFNKKLDAIFVEHQLQTEQLVNIKNEYDVHMQEHQQEQLDCYDAIQPLLYEQLQEQQQQQQTQQHQQQQQQQQQQQTHLVGGGLQLTSSCVQPTVLLSTLEKRL